MPAKETSHLSSGLNIAVILIVFSVILHFTNTYQDKMLNMLFYPIVILSMVLFCYIYGKKQKDKVSFNQIFSYGFKTICTTTLIMILWNILSMKYLFPEHTAQVMVQQAKEMQAQDSHIRANPFEPFQQHFYTFTMSSTLLMFAITGLVGALLGAALGKRRSK